jgi:prophage antirepressor-like protein
MKQLSADLTTPDLFGTEIRRVDINGEDWFAAQDVCKALEIGNITMALRALDEDEKGLNSVETLGGFQMLNIVSESGLFHLTFLSRKPVAKAFRRWVTKELLPAIRRQGFYADPNLMLRTKEYLLMREIANPSDGFGHTCMAVCRRIGVTPERHRKRGHAFPARVLDEAARGKPAGRGPLVRGEAVDVFVFIAKGVE